MIPGRTLERLQAGAIIRPDQPVLINVGEAKVLVKVLSLWRLEQVQALFSNLKPDGSDDDIKAAIQTMGDVVREIVAEVSGVVDIDDEPVDIDIEKEPAVMPFQFWHEVIMDTIQLSGLNRGILGKSDSSATSPTKAKPAPKPGPASKPAAAGENATKKGRKRRS